MRIRRRAWLPVSYTHLCCLQSPHERAEMGKVAVDDGASVGDAALVVAADGKSEAAGLLVFQRIHQERISEEDVYKRQDREEVMSLEGAICCISGGSRGC